MWQNWLSGIFGLWIILLPFLGLPLTLNRTLLILSGLIVAILGFWATSNGGSSQKSSSPPMPGPTTGSSSMPPRQF